MERGVLRASDSLRGVADWPEVAARRLVWLLGVAIVVAITGSLLALLRQPNVGELAGTARPLILAPIWLALLFGAFAFARSRRFSARLRLDVGLGVMVATCALAGLYRHWLPYQADDVMRGVSPVALVVLLVAVVVPVPPRRMAVAAALAAVVDGVALWITIAVGNPTPPWNLWLWLLAPDVFVAVLSVMTSRFIHQLSETIARVREMGSYRLVEKLGAGGMGEVWRAEHRSLARPAAIKLVLPELLGAKDNERQAAEMAARFEREARATAALRSPHTIEVYDFGRAEDGSFYYVMELLDGMNLDTLIRRAGPLPEARVVHFMRQIAHSLHEAHLSGLIHRDVKPANVFICKLGTDRDFVKVLDFGLVKVESEDAARLTAAGAVMGTASFMPPEMARGIEATPRSDIYAFGCVAYWMLAGRLVFSHRMGYAEQVLAHVEEAPPPPSRFVAISAELEALVLECLAKDPADRPADFAEVERRLRGLATAAAWSSDDARRWWTGDMGGPMANESALGATVPQPVNQGPGEVATKPLHGG